MKHSSISALSKGGNYTIHDDGLHADMISHIHPKTLRHYRNIQLNCFNVLRACNVCIIATHAQACHGTACSLFQVYGWRTMITIYPTIVSHLINMTRQCYYRQS